MAEFIDSNELMYQNYEPQLKNRGILIIDGIPTYMIRKFDLPKFESAVVTMPHINVERYSKGKSKWTPINMELYTPITPSGQQIVMNWFRLSHESVTGRDGYISMYQKDCTAQILGPMGEVASQFTLKSAWIRTSNFGEIDWSSESDPQIISAEIVYNYAVLDF